jgi:hypothetical protein
VLAFWRMIDHLVLEHPGEVVWDKNGVEAGGECRIDIGLGTVADHPGGSCVAAVVLAQTAVSGLVFLGKHFDFLEVLADAGALELVGLLGEVTLGDHDAAVIFCEVGQRVRDAGEKLDLLVGDGVGEADDAIVLFWCDGLIGELFEAGDKGLVEALEAVAVFLDGLVLDVVEMLADLVGGKLSVIEIGDEAGDRALEVDVVFPKGIVGVEEKGLAGREGLELVAGLGHNGIIGLVSSGSLWERLPLAFGSVTSVVAGVEIARETAATT